jgi:methanogenic corrinoid protein MtbC1
MYQLFKQFEHEIFFDVYESILNLQTTLTKKTINLLGKGELHHLIQYHQKTVLSALFFEDTLLMHRYHKWLYRVYYYRNVDLDFFYFLNMLFKEKYLLYIDKNTSLLIDTYFDFITQKHQEFKNSAYLRSNLLEINDEVHEFTKLLLDANKEGVCDILKSKINTLNDFLEFYNSTIAGSMKHIGYLWEVGDISVAEEHIASTTLHEATLKIIHSISPLDPKNLQIMLSSAPNELHSLGVEVASLIFEKLGYKVINLGVNIPAKEIVRAISINQPSCVILSATLTNSLVDIFSIIQELHLNKLNFDSELKIGIAGGAFEYIHSPRQQLSADFYLEKLRDFDL